MVEVNRGNAPRDPRQPPRPSPGAHPGAANYPVDGAAGPRPPRQGPPPPRQRPPGPPPAGPPPTGNPPTAAYPPPGATRHETRQQTSHNPHLPPLDETDYHRDDNQRAMPRKLTVTRVAALRGRELTSKGIGKIHQAATADGADRSGLTALTYPTVVNFAVDAAMTIALANTLFFAAASAESKGKVGLYLLLTIAPFAIIAPLIGPMLDKLQRGRRIAMAGTFAGRTLLAVLIMANCGWDSAAGQLTYDPWVLYPCALGMLVLSKSFGVLKSAVTPRVLPPSIDLVRVNSRLTTFGLVGGTIIGGGVAALCEVLLGKVLPLHLPGAMVWLAIITVVGAVLCMRIPSWVEVTAGEVPTTLTYHGEPARDPLYRPDSGPAATEPPGEKQSPVKALAASMRQPLGRNVLVGLWGNGTIRILTGFLTLFIAFYAKSQQGGGSGWAQVAMLGAVGAAAGIGNFIGNATGTRLELKNPQNIIVIVTGACMVVAAVAAIFSNLLLIAIAALIASGTSAIGKVCLDSSIQDDLPDESRASAFGRSETVLQMSWVFGASLGVLLPPNLTIGFGVVAGLLALGFIQTFVTNRGSTLVPGFGGKRPDMTMPTGAIHIDPKTREAWNKGAHGA
ncbi:MAG: MFS transporter [Gordonia sp.]|nr:MFS transporter [Gordonia sp. (in: high G+C Gram-positive bacteria)]OZG29642.1 MFS transporter [Williamsia sp. 1138]